MRLRTALVLLTSLAPVPACRPPDGAPAQNEAAGPPFFVEVAAQSGLHFVHENGATGEYYYPELLHGGAAFLDYDNDSFLDVYLVQSGPLPVGRNDRLKPSNQLYHNRGDGTFEEVTEAAGVGDRGYGAGVTVADYDGDGWVDIYVTNLGANTLYRSNGADAQGRVTFTDVTATAGVGDRGYSTGAAFFDYDGDGDLDLYVCNYLDWSPRIERPCLGRNGLRGYCSPGEYDRPQADTLYRNDGPGPQGQVTFSDQSREVGLASVRGTGLGLVTADFDGDGRVDVYVANDQMPNHLWLNNGDGTFREEGLLSGGALNESGQAEAGMGVTTGDWDRDGDWDLFMVHLSGETNTFYRNDGGVFRDVTDAVRLGAVSQPYTGFGTGLVDFDNDGYLDIFIANGKVRPGDTVEPDYAEPNQLLRGTPQGPFLDISDQAGPALALLEVSRGAAFGDYDNDGDTDILLVNNQGPVRLLRNDVLKHNHWLSVELVGKRPNRHALGARITVETGRGPQHRRVHTAYSYASSHDPRSHFGLGDEDRVELLRVTWPDGTTEELKDVAADQFLKLTEPTAGAPVPQTGS